MKWGLMELVVVKQTQDGLQNTDRGKINVMSYFTSHDPRLTSSS